MDQDMRNESSPIRPERLMRSISEYKNDDAIFLLMLVLQQYGQHVI